jgi:hypothetical protein
MNFEILSGIQNKLTAYLARDGETKDRQRKSVGYHTIEE